MATRKRGTALQGVSAGIVPVVLAGTLGILALAGAVERGAEPGPGTAFAAGAVGVPERKHLTVGLARNNAIQLPLYLAVERTARAEGLSVDVVSFGGGPRAAAALASGSVEVAATSLTSAINLLAAGQPVRAFFGAGSQAEFEWFARRPVKDWKDLRGKSVAISAYGSLTEVLTRHLLRKHGLVPERDVQFVQAGETATLVASLKAGRVDAAILSPPFTWHAEDHGFVRLGTQAKDIAAAWPRNLLIAKETFLADCPNTVLALLRAYVRAIRLAREDPEVAVQIIMERLKYERRYAERAYLEVMAGFDERGRLPVKVMPLFWEISIAAGEVKEPWPESRFFDRRFVDSFDEWAPK